MPFNLRGPEILILILIILLLFGAKRLPDVARGLGRSLRILKAETKEMSADGTPAPDAPAADVPPAAVESAPQATLPPAGQSAAPASQPERTET